MQRKNEECAFDWKWEQNNKVTHSVYDNAKQLMKKHQVWMETALVMEAGCGRGEFGRSLISDRRFCTTGIDMVGVDITEQNTEKTCGYVFKKGDLEDRSLFGEETFDYILCPCVLHHFTDLTKVVSNLSHWLKRQGRMIIIEPNGGNPVLRFSSILRSLLFKSIADKHSYASANETMYSGFELALELKKHRLHVCVEADYFTSERCVSDNRFIDSLLSIREFLARSRFFTGMECGTVLFMIAQKY